MSIHDKNYGGKVLVLHSLLLNLCEDFHCNFTYTPDIVPSYDTQEPHLFGRFPWYYELVSRSRSFYVHKHKKFFTGISLPWETGKDNFLVGSLVLLRPEFYGSIENLATFVEIISEKANCSIVIKHIEESNAMKLLENGFRYYGNKEGWSESAKEDDQTFPEVVVRFEETLSKPPVLQRSHSKAKKIQNEFSVECIDTLRLERSEIRNRYKQEILYVFYKWMEHFHKRQPWSVNADFLKWHLGAFETLVADHRLILVFLRNSLYEPIGVISLAKTSRLQLDVVFSFIINEEGDFQRLAYRAIFDRMFQLGFKYMNLGGSEQESLFKFKNSLAASSLIQGRHVVFERRQTNQ